MGKNIYFTGTSSGRSYNYNNTTYIVSSRFSPIGDGPFMRDSLENLLKNDFVHYELNLILVSLIMILLLLLLNL